MKNLVATLVISLGASSAFASSLSAVLSEVQINGKTEFGDVAILNVDEKTQTLTMNIMNDACGHYRDDGQAHCMAMPSLVKSLNVPYTVQDDGCGSKIYSGSFDARPADGSLDQIEFTDNSKRVCENMIPALLVVRASITVAGRGGGTITEIRALGNNPPTLVQPWPKK